MGRHVVENKKFYILNYVRAFSSITSEDMETRKSMTNSPLQYHEVKQVSSLHLSDTAIYSHLSARSYSQ